jgi:hypothetical protein
VAYNDLENYINNNSGQDFDLSSIEEEEKRVKE